MYSLIIEQIINNSDYQDLDLAFQDQLNDSKLVSGVTYWTNDLFENHSFNNQTISPNWPCSSFNLGFFGSTTIYLSFVQSQFCDRNINFFNDFSETFWSEYEPIHEVTNDYGNIADGKTHLDSVAEAVFNAVLGALESFVKAVKELASKALNWIWGMLRSLINRIMKPINEAMKSLFNSVISILLEFYGMNSGDQTEGRQDAATYTVNSLLTAFLACVLLGVLTTVFIALYAADLTLGAILKVVSGGMAGVVGEFIKPLIISLIISTIISMLLKIEEYTPNNEVDHWSIIQPIIQYPTVAISKSHVDLQVATFGIVKALGGLIKLLLSPQKGGTTFKTLIKLTIFKSFFFAVLSFTFELFKSAINQISPAAFFLDILSLILSLVSIYEAFKGKVTPQELAAEKIQLGFTKWVVKALAVMAFIFPLHGLLTTPYLGGYSTFWG
jgi:hypothetical protein